MQFTPQEIEQLQSIIDRANDDTAISIARSFERLEERIDAMESRLYSRLVEIDDQIVQETGILSDKIADLRNKPKRSTREITH